MKTIEVVCAIIFKEGKVLATQRGYGEYKEGWEFPGGKVEADETPEAALVREIHEELNAAIAVDQYLCQVEYDYPNFHLSMKCYLSSLMQESIDLLEHEDARWLDANSIDTVDWLPADLDVVEVIKQSVFAV